MLVRGTLLIFLIGILLPVHIYAKLDYQRLETELVHPRTAGIQVVLVNLFGDCTKEILLFPPEKDSLTIYYFKDNRLMPVTLKLPDNARYASIFYLQRVNNSEVWNIAYLSGKTIYYFPQKGSRISGSPDILTTLTLNISSSFTSPTPDEKDLVKNPDLDNDGYEEILIPTGDTIGFLSRREDGKYLFKSLPGKSVGVLLSMGTKKTSSYFDEEFKPAAEVYLSSRMFNNFLFKDVNGDNLLDCLRFKNSRWHIYLQKKPLTFSEEADYILPEDTDTAYYENVVELNGDGIPDVVLTNTRYDIMSPQTEVKILYGEKPSEDSNEIKFINTKVYRHKDPVGLVYLVDVNNDHRLDIVSTYFSYNFASAEQLIDYAFGKWLRFKLRYYLQRDNGDFPDLPDFEKEITIRREFVFRSFNSIVLDCDINGDHWKDLFIMPDKERCELYLFDSEKKNFEKHPVKLVLKSPGIVSETPLLTDINNDGTLDVVLFKNAGSKRYLEIFLLKSKNE